THLFQRVASTADRGSATGVKLKFKPNPTRPPPPPRLVRLLGLSRASLIFAESSQSPSQLAHLCHHRFVSDRVSAVPIAPLPRSRRCAWSSAPQDTASTVPHGSAAAGPPRATPGAATVGVVGNLQATPQSGRG